jgi:hypothetical protein
VYKLCVYRLCVYRLCVYKLCVYRLCVQIEVEGVHPVVCMMNKISMIFITVKHNLYYIENKLRLHVSTLWGSSSGLYNVMKLLVHKNYILPDGIPSGLHMYVR